MFEKNLGMGFLLDFYGQMLTERKRTVMNMYYNEDLSLSEISEEIRELIKRSEAELSALEESLKLAARFLRLRASAEKVEGIIAEYELPDEVRTAVLDLTGELKQ